ncbi:hypothetical protein F4806DRAFT_67013 [Annulohypoxylon nitens]|nr:hypothetical protein F4806DRAFT_67013 [Annulohypoxylon nitens]
MKGGVRPHTLSFLSRPILCLDLSPDRPMAISPKELLSRPTHAGVCHTSQGRGENIMIIGGSERWRGERGSDNGTARHRYLDVVIQFPYSPTNLPLLQ